MTTTRLSPTDPPAVEVRSPTDLIAAVPYLLGFHPTDSVVVLAIRGDRIDFAARRDLPNRGERASTLARHLIDVVTRQTPAEVVIIGYGPPGRVDPLVAAARVAAARRPFLVREVLRVQDRRWWSYTCDDPGCCPPEGTPFDISTSAVAAACSYSGLTAAPNRGELGTLVAPVVGSARISMTQATDRAGDRFLTQFDRLPDDGERSAALLAAGEAAVRAAIDRVAENGLLDDDEAAWLTVLLACLPVRDLAWRSIDGEQPHLRLWLDLTRRADPELAPAPASLLAFTAWRCGDGTLAGLALERALHEDPSYAMAQLLLHGLRHGLPPSTFDGWGTPAWGQNGSEAEDPDERGPSDHEQHHGPEGTGRA